MINQCQAKRRGVSEKIEAVQYMYRKWERSSPLRRERGVSIKCDFWSHVKERNNPGLLPYSVERIRLDEETKRKGNLMPYCRYGIPGGKPVMGEWRMQGGQGSLWAVRHDRELLSALCIALPGLHTWNQVRQGVDWSCCESLLSPGVKVNGIKRVTLAFGRKRLCRPTTLSTLDWLPYRWSVVHPLLLFPDVRKREKTTFNNNNKHTRKTWAAVAGRS